MRLVTRGDLDGLCCAVLICLKEGVDDFLLVHPQSITDGEVEILPTDIVAHLPYQPGCAMWFDNQHQTATVAAPDADFKGAFGQAPSAARLVYEYYGGREELPQFAVLVDGADRLAAANLTIDDIQSPQGYVKLGFTIDSRSGLGAFEGYFMTLLHLLLKNAPIESILEHPEVRQRAELLERADALFRHTLETSSRLDGNVVVSDLRELDYVPMGNRFLVYALYPRANVSVRLQYGPKRTVMMTLGHSILNRTCQTHLGELAARYGGGGRRGASSIPLIDEKPELEIQMIIGELKANG